MHGDQGWLATRLWCILGITRWPVASFTKEVNPRLPKRPLKIKGRLANRGLTSLVKETTEVYFTNKA